MTAVLSLGMAERSAEQCNATQFPQGGRVIIIMTEILKIKESTQTNMHAYNS